MKVINKITWEVWNANLSVKTQKAEDTQRKAKYIETLERCFQMQVTGKFPGTGITKIPECFTCTDSSYEPVACAAHTQQRSR